MIRYALVCETGHEFESWFPSGDAYDEQATRGFVVCPVCDSKKVAKTLMAPALGRASTSNRDVQPAAPSESVPMNNEADRRLRALFRAMHNHIRNNAKNVGADFATEARSMHYGEIPHSAIYGAASPDEARALIEEGVEICPLPPMPGDQN